MEKAPRSGRKVNGRQYRKKPWEGRTTLAEATRKMLRIVNNAADEFYSVQEPDTKERPTFLMQNLVDESGIYIFKRRVYEVLHLWEALGLVRRAGKRAYTWHGEEGYRAFRERVLGASPTLSCHAFVSSELAQRGTADPQRMALAVYFLFEHPGTISMGDEWNRADFRELCGEAAISARVPGWERRYYDVLNIFTALSIVSPRVSLSKQRCRMAWTPDAMTSVPRSGEQVVASEVDDDGEEIVIVDVLGPLPTPPREKKQTLTTPDTRPTIHRYHRNPGEKEGSVPDSRPMRKRNRQQVAPVERPVRKRTPSARALDGMDPSTPFAADPIVQPMRSSVFTSSSDSNGSSEPDGPPYNQFTCDADAWNDFSIWAAGDNTLPPLFDNDVLRLEPLQSSAFTGTH